MTTTHLHSDAPAAAAPTAQAAGSAAAHACCHGAPQAAASPMPAVAAARHATRPAASPWTAATAATAARNTLVCLLGCSIGDVGVVLVARAGIVAWPMGVLMLAAIVAGLATSLVLESLLLRRQGHAWARAVRLAAGMSLISMLAMEVAMNAVDLGLSGGMRVQLPWSSYLGILAVGEVAGFAAAFPYNWWRLACFGQACH